MIISSGVEYKTDLKTYGGQGFDVVNQVFDYIKSTDVRDKIFKSNALKLLAWWAPKPVEKTFGNLVTCSVCGTMSEDVSKWFSKDGLYFYTPAPPQKITTLPKSMHPKLYKKILKFYKIF